MKQFRAAAIFTHHMVLQREKPISIWGTASADQEGKTVRVSIHNQTTNCVCCDGQWCVALPALLAGGPYEIVIECDKEQIMFQDVYIGEVWIASGQSNMELPLRDENSVAQQKNCIHQPLLRFYKVYQTGVYSQKEYESSWVLDGEDSVMDFSAVGYYYGRQLQENLGIAVGVIGCYLGGTSISCWMPQEKMKTFSEGEAYLTDYAQKSGDKTKEQFQEEEMEFRDAFNKWLNTVEKIKVEYPDASEEERKKLAGACPWNPPAGAWSPYRPGGIYETMLKRICPYGVAGFLYYQGEEDTSCPNRYQTMLRTLIDVWRETWEEELPFVIVQLPMYKEAGAEENYSWAKVRAAQFQVAYEKNQCSLVVLIDEGEFDNIHPTNKKVVGARLCLSVLEHFYEMEVSGTSTMAIDAVFSGHEIKVYFDGPIEARGESTLLFCEKEGCLEQVHTIQIEDNCLSCHLEHGIPTGIQYAYVNYGKANLYGLNGLPVAPFSFSK